jgi:hypothetical protein
MNITVELSSTPTDGATDVVVAAPTNRLQVAVGTSLKIRQSFRFSGSAVEEDPRGRIVSQVESACAVDPCGQ